MLNVIDTATPQRNLNWGTAFAEGWTRVYIKLGGTNVSPIYVSPYYRQQVDSAISVGMKNIGHYWVPNARHSSPTSQADFMVDNLHRWDKNSHFIVLDNESLDDGVRFNDAQAAEFINRIKARLGIPGSQVLTYSGLNDARNTSWPSVLATGSNFIIAAYSYPPMQLPSIPTIPSDRIVGHQYGGKAIGGVITDTNTFTDNAFAFTGGGGGGGGGGSMYNPFKSWPITGTWEDHASYSAGGTDYPLPNRTALPAPASGTLRISGGSGEFAAGFVGSAGRRSILTLDKPLNRIAGRKARPPEGEGPMVALVFQHQSAFGTPKHYDQQEVLGFSGNSDGTASGGDYHLHIHGLNAAGQRLRFESFVDQSSPAGGGGVIPITEEDMPNSILARTDVTGSVYVWNLATGAIQHVPDTYQLSILQRFLPSASFAEENQFQFIRDTYGATLSEKAAPPQVVIDIAAISKLVSEAVIKEINEQGVTAEVDYDKVAESVDAVLEDNFATIPKAVTDQFREDLAPSE